MEAVFTDKHFNLVASCKQGNKAAHFELYKLYSKAMYNVAFRIVNDTDEANDVLQEAFLDAFGRIKDFRQETTFGDQPDSENSRKFNFTKIYKGYVGKSGSDNKVTIKSNFQRVSFN